MREEVPLIVGLGEILWDRFPDGDRLGGAPANFAFHAAQLGGSARTVSRIGEDAEAERLVAVLREHEVDTEYLQRDLLHPTGRVMIHLHDGQPTYEITEPVAWDFLEMTTDLEELAKLTDAVSFGTLAQRNIVSRAAIQQFIEGVPATALRLFDINLRQSFYSREIIEFGLAHATILKLNEEELTVLAELFACPAQPERFFNRMRDEFGLKGMALTLGEDGCEIHYQSQIVHSIPPKTELKNAVGAGDAFAAALVIGLLRHDLLQYVADRANEVGAYVASQDGAMPRLPETLLTVL